MKAFFNTSHYCWEMLMIAYLACVTVFSFSLLGTWWRSRSFYSQNVEVIDIWNRSQENRSCEVKLSLHLELHFRYLLSHPSKDSEFFFVFKDICEICNFFLNVENVNFFCPPIYWCPVYSLGCKDIWILPWFSLYSPGTNYWYVL